MAANDSSWLDAPVKYILGGGSATSTCGGKKDEGDADVYCDFCCAGWCSRGTGTTMEGVGCCSARLVVVVVVSGSLGDGLGSPPPEEIDDR